MVNEKNVKKLLQQVNPSKVVAATKYVEAKDIRELYHLGIRDVGENRVAAFLEKFEELKDLDLTWHFIGHLQSKKVKSVINKVDYLHSLDRLSLAEEIQKNRTKALDCFIEVNISDEASKYGLPVSEVSSFCEKLKNYDKIHIVGLMGMALLTEDSKEIIREFTKLTELKEELNKQSNLEIKYLSMGMSNDYLIALECGATHLRLGSILFRNEDL
ncbi:MAG: YggS family pyridoxal phosphate-dependent enzyme [Tenericutes bacterium]|nr:YggS family pyridoxal phosphate-dependent enzyme [Mycoplasmatota bacterium]